MKHGIHILITGVVITGGLLMTFYTEFEAHSNSENNKISGVLDRFEGELAVILIEELNQELILSKNTLPDGSAVHTWFDIEQHHENIEIVSINLQKTKAEREKVNNSMKKLRQNDF